MRVTLVFLLCVVGLVAVIAFCPNNCNNHGTCQGSVCSCTHPWAGSDCSYENQEVVSGQVYEQKAPIPTFGWAYYYIDVPKTKPTIRWNVNQTSSGDCDLYVRRGTFPTRTTWDQRDVTADREVYIETKQALDGRWVAGVYGFISCSFNFSVTLYGASTCPKNCSGRGLCGVNGQCICDAGWSGDACETMPYLTPGTPVSDTVLQGAWRYYMTNVTKVPALLTYNMTQTTGGDADLYIGFSAPPTPTSYFSQNLTSGMETLILVEATTAGTYYAGVRGFLAPSGSDMKIAYNLVLDMPTSTCTDTSHCSGPTHGTCTSTGCNCNSDYKGSVCEEKKTPIALGTSYSGYVADSIWNYYFLYGLDNKEITVSVSQSETGDCDLYIRPSQKPTLLQYEYAEISGSKSFNLTIENPLDSIWYIGIFGWTPCSYTLTAKYRSDKNCGNHGVWDNTIGGCVCNSNWTGPQCENRIITLQNGQVYNGTVTFQEWVYFNINVFGTHMLEVRLKETTPNDGVPGSVWLYLNADGYPTLQTYDKADTSTHSFVHSVGYDQKHQLDGNYYIGVYGSPYAHRNVTNRFSIVAWHPGF